MKEHLFVWIDEDMEYVHGVMAFLQHSTYKDLIDLKVFTTVSNAEMFLQRTSMRPLIIGTQQILHAMTLVDGHHQIVILQEQVSDIHEQSSTGRVYLYKYQALTRLLTQLCQIDKARKQALGLADQLSARKSRIIGVYAAVGHCGKSTLALNIARSLVIKDYRVLYISLESIGTADFVLQAGMDIEQSGEMLSQLMYFLRMDRSKFVSKLATIIKRDTRSGIDYISAINQVREMEEMSKPDVKLFLETIAQNDQYDWIVIDLESSLHPRIVTAMESCDDIIWLIQDDAICLHKSELIHKSLPSLNRTHFVVNKYTGRMAVDAATYGCEPSFFLPYIPEWKNTSNPNALITHRVYQEAVSFVIRELEKPTMSKGRLVHEGR